MYSVSWLIFSWFFSWVFGSVSLRDLLDDPGTSPLRLFNKSTPYSFSLRFPCDPRAAPLPCKFTSVGLHLFPESTFVLTLVCVSSSVVAGRLRGGYVGPPTAFPVRAPVYRGCPCRDPPGCHRVQGDSGKAPNLIVCLLVLLES